MNFLSNIDDIKKNNFYILLIILSFFLRSLDFLSYKLIYLFQIFLIILVFNKNINFNKSYIFFFLLLLGSLFYDIEIKYFAYLFFIILINILFKNKVKISFKFNDIIFYLSLLSLVLFSKEINQEKFFLVILYESFISDFSILFTPKFYNLRYSYFGFDANYASIFFLMSYNLLFFNYQKKFIIKFTIFAFILILLTKSKSGLLFYFASICYYKYRYSFKRQILIILLINLFFFLASHFFYKNFSNPFEQGNSTKINRVYVKDVCSKENFLLIKYLTSCNYKNFIGTQFFGVSIYYKFWTAGYSINDIINNHKVYFLPNSEKRRLKKNSLDKYKAKNHLSTHNFILKSVYHYGILYFIILIVNILTFFKRNITFNFFQLFIASTFIGLDLLLFFPILVLSLENR